MTITTENKITCFFPSQFTLNNELLYCSISLQHLQAINEKHNTSWPLIAFINSTWTFMKIKKRIEVEMKIIAHFQIFPTTIFMSDIIFFTFLCWPKKGGFYIFQREDVNLHPVFFKWWSSFSYKYPTFFRSSYVSFRCILPLNISNFGY